MKIGFYNPYFDSISGGERYLLTLASHWSKLHDVSLFWDDPKILKESESRLNIDLSRVRTAENVFKTKNVFRKLAVSRGYDLIFFLTDGSIPTTFAKRNILHFQVPFREIAVHPIKLTRFQSIVCNSHFTKKHLDPRVGSRSMVIYPPVKAIKRTDEPKKNIILSVGRFHHLKKQNVLIDIFRKALKSNRLVGFRLILAGGLMPEDSEYFTSLKKLGRGLPVRFLPNSPFTTLTKLYNESRIYWHAAGYGEKRAEHMEHFGITTVEAMSAGCIPVVYNGGGQPEIVRNTLWTTRDQCLDITEEVIKNKNDSLKQSMIRQSERFNVRIFTKAFDSVLSQLR